MFKRLFLLACFVLMLGSVSNAANIQWTDLGPDHLWSTPANWDLGGVPALADEVRIDVPAAAAPNGPVIQDGIVAQAKGIFTEAPGEPTLTMTGGSLEVADWIWWGDGANSFATWTMSGGTVTVTNEFELGWGGGAGTLIMTGGTINAGEAVIPTGSGAFGHLFLNGGTYNVTKPGGLKVNQTGLIDITTGTLVIEGDETTKVNDLIAAGRITAYGGSGRLKVDYNQSHPGKTTLSAVEKVVVLSEDFEGLPLGPNVDETLAGGQVWTDTPSAGWTVDESGVPGIGDPATDGVTEWAGWAFANKDWWIQAAGNQRRVEFALGQGTVAVADPDEWDDAAHPGPNSANPYDTWLSTPAIDVSGLEAGSLQLKFDSSWRPEYDDNYHQTANITVSFDGAAPVEVLRWESDAASPNFKPDTSTNETVIVDLGNPAGAKSVVVTFGLFEAGNDWWWAIDNVEVSGLPIAPYVYDGDAAVAGPANSNDSLDGTWDHNNGSDAWDGTGLGVGGPGGASALVEDGVTFLRIQDTGDPRDYGKPDPSNRKVYFTHAIDFGLDGARLEFRARVATSPPLDDMHPDGGAGITPWPAGGRGYHIRDNGKGMFGIAEGGLGIISFSLAQAGETGFENVATDVLVMNNLVANVPSGNVDTGEAATATNMLAIADATQWNTFVIDIAAGGAGTHTVSVSVNGGPAQSFEVTVGTDLEGTGSYITMGSSGTGGLTAFDVDYISVARPRPAPTDPSQVIYYSFDNVDGVVPDQSGKGHDGVVNGAVTAEAGGKYNGAANFASGGYLDLGGPGFPAEDIPTSGMTLAAWIKCKNTGDHHAIFNARASDQTWVVHPEARSNGEFRWLLRSYGGTTIFDLRAGAVTWDEWLHFAGTYDKASGKATVCINGELAKELDVINPTDIAGDWGLGARVGKNIDDARPFTGLMDEFRLFTRALSQDEIKKIMQGP